MRRIIGAVVALAVGDLMGAQEPMDLRGIVRDPAGAPLPAVFVQVAGTKFGVQTNDDGRFLLRRTESDSNRVVFRKIGYEFFEAKFDSLYASAGSGRIVITLRPIPPTYDGPRPPNRPLNIHDDTIPEFDVIGITRAAKLRPLANAPRSDGEKEIRLVMPSGYRGRDHLVVLRSRDGRVRGDLWVWAAVWSRDSTHRARDQDAKVYGCRAERAYPNVGACRAKFARAPDWTRLWRRLDSLDVWTLPHGDELLSTSLSITHPVGLTIEMFDGERFRSVSHYSPEFQPSPESKRKGHSRIADVHHWPGSPRGVESQSSRVKSR